MRNVPKKTHPKYDMYKTAVYEYFPMEINTEEKLLANKLLTCLTRPRRKIELTEEEAEELKAIRANVESGAYTP